ncbi:MAG: hypothetical protein HZC48_07635 [Nitrospirae bacterium]|nr:hypothetical protein [Nitrospirota bacterium]
MVNDKYAPYYARWVSACYDFVNQPLSEVLPKEQKEDFFKYFTKNHEDWQVKQAALRRYDYYLSGLQTSAKQKSPQNKGEWSIVETNMQKAMRLRHMSY